MARKNSISQLDLVLLGGRGLTARLGSVENTIKKLSIDSGGDGTGAQLVETRPNLFSNSSFEFFDRGSSKPQDWTTAGTAAVSVGSAGADGTNTLRLSSTGSAAQVAAGGVTVPHSSIVVSIAARAETAGQKVGINITHAPGYQPGPVVRLDQNGTTFQSDDVPPDGQWYRFYRSFILTGGGTVAAVFSQVGSAGTIELDAAKFEKEDGVASWLEPTAFLAADWGAATHIRNLSAANIITGTLVVGGSTSDNPRISVKDDSDIEIVTIGDPTGGFYGIEIKGEAGFRISGSGSAEVFGGGSVQVKGGGDITLDGGDLNVTNGTINVNAATGGINVSGGGDITIGLGGNLYVYGAANIGGETTIGGNLLVNGTSELNGDLSVTGDLAVTSGLIRVGELTGKRLVFGASGLEAYNASSDRTMLLDVDTATWRIFGENAVVMEADGSLKAGELAWVDAAGFWATDYLGNAAFGVSGLDAHLWGGKSMDKGDVMLGGNSSYVYWDASTSKLTVSGNLSAGNGKATVDDKGITLVSDISSDEARPHYIKWYHPEGLATHATIAAQWNGFGGQSNLILHSQQPTSGSDVLVQQWANSSGSSWLCWVGDNYGGTWHSVKLNVNSQGVSYTSGFVFVDNGGLKVGGTEASPGIGNIMAAGRLYAGTTSSYFYSDDGVRTAHQGNIVFWNDIYHGTRGQWLSNVFNQLLKTTDSPTFANVSISGVGSVWGTLTNQSVRTDANVTFNQVTSGEIYSNSWFRSNTSGAGWYHQVHGVGWYANSNGLMRNYNNSQIQLTFAADKHLRMGLTAAVLTGGSNNGGAMYFGADSATATQQTGGIETSWGDATQPRIAIGVTRDGGKAASVWFYDQSYVLKQTATNRMRMGTNGNISIGTTTTDVSWLLTLALDSAAKPNGGTWINASSDSRTKEVIGQYEYGLEAVRKLNLVRYEYNGLGGTVEGLRGVGFVAQEAQQVIPEMVGTRMAKLHEEDEHETELLTLSIDPAIYATMKGVQELADLVDGLTSKVADLEARLAA